MKSSLVAITTSSFVAAAAVFPATLGKFIGVVSSFSIPPSPAIQQVVLTCMNQNRLRDCGSTIIHCHPHNRRSRSRLETATATAAKPHNSKICLNMFPREVPSEIIDDVNDSSNNHTEVWIPFGLLLFSQFILFIGVGAVIPSLPLYGKELGLAGAANGIVISAPAVALLLCANKAGQLADRQGRKTAMIYGMVLIAISDIGTAISNDLFTLAIARLGLGAGRAVSESGERGMLADFANRLPDGVRGKALAAQQAIVALGIAIGAPVGGVVVEQYGPRASFLCVSAAAVITCALYGFLPETLPTALSTHGLRRDDGIDNMKKMPMLTNEICDRNEHGSFRLWRDLLRDDEWKGLSLVQAGVSFGYAAKIAAIPILATDVYENGAVGTGTLLSAAALSGLVGAPLGGLVTDRVGAKQTAVFSGIIAGLALVVVPISLLTRSQSFPSHLDVPTVAVRNLVLDGRSFSFSALVLVWSMATAAQGPALTAFAQTKAARGLEATSLALVKAAGDLTYIFAPLLMGLLADTIEVPGVQCVLAGFAILLGTSAFAILSEDEGRTNEVKENSE